MSSITLRRAVLLALAPMSLITTAYAQNEQQPAVVELDPMLVTVTKSATKASNLVAQTKVITAKDLERHQGQNLLDVIKTQAGISHYTSGGSDKVSNFYLRGFDSSGVLVLIDGVRYGSLTTGQPALAMLNANEVERIEIAYGASGSSVYGANAMGGVIQVFTKKGSSDGSKVAISVGGGTHGAFDYGINAGFANENSKINLSATHSESDGINAIVSPYAASQRDDDGFDKQSVSLSGSHRFDRVEIGLNALGSQSEVAYDNTWSSESNIYAKQKGGAASVYGTFNYADNSAVKLQYGESIDQSTNYAGNQPTGTFDSHQKQANLSLTHTIGAGKILAGAEHLRQEVKSDTAYTQTKRDNAGYYLGYQASYDKLDAQAFVRYDDNSWYGDDTNYNAGVAYRISPAVRIGANYATGFKAPTFNQLYWPQDQWGGGGNPNLRPETSKNSEAFIELTGNNHKTRITGYHTDAKDLIAGWPAQNINKAEITGVTITSDWQANNYLAGLSYDYQEANAIATNANGEKTKSNLTVRPEHKGTAYVGYATDDFNIRAEYQKVGSYYMTGNHGGKMPSYGLVNLSGSYDLSPNISVTHRLNNLFNKKYATNESFGTRYNEDGTNFHTAITLKY